MDMMEMRFRMMAMLAEGANDGMELIGTYTFQESCENDSTGNATNVFETVLAPYLEDDNLFNVYVCVFENNNTSFTNYKADLIIAAPKGINIGSFIYTIRNNRTNGGGLGTNRSFYVSAGTVVKIYRLYND